MILVTTVRGTTIADSCGCSSQPLWTTVQDAHMPWRARGPDGDRQAVVSRPRSRSRRRCAPARGGRCRRAGPTNRRGERSSLAGRFPQDAVDGVLSAGADLTAGARTQERFSHHRQRAGGPIVAPWNTPTVPTLQQPDPRKLRQMQRISGFRRVGDPGLEPGTSSLSGKPDVPSSPLDSHLIPANRRDGAGGRGLEGTGEDKLVAPSWPHDCRSKAWCRMTRKRTSNRRYGQARTLRRPPASA